ncbi:SsrA-binding protein SmpB [Saccharospirillum salsuginis]|uniref:SsrA-binding protein n=1 Tax=Saccharospirillum salsuginis TaxID=418750 RepID=A0A918K9C1_9GAMM|nr:SsrA-binding protein SmpB [Saccharospirillum salsuginis]GGX55537.1 SsrA-binding protein [Saccharospirillum salsuginis]
MSKPKKKPQPGDSTIAKNKKARHEYQIIDKYEAGLELMGWEVKSLRAGKAQLVDSYVIFKNNEAWLVGAHFTPLNTASTHVVADPTRSRKLLMHRREIDKLARQAEMEGYTAVCFALYWKKNKVKADICLVKGKKLHDKRATMKERDWNRQKQRVLKAYNQ